MKIMCKECDNIIKLEELDHFPALETLCLCSQCYVELKYGVLYPAKFAMIWGTNIDSSDESEASNALDNGVRTMEDAHASR